MLDCANLSGGETLQRQFAASKLEPPTIMRRTPVDSRDILLPPHMGLAQPSPARQQSFIGRQVSNARVPIVPSTPAHPASFLAQGNFQPSPSRQDPRVAQFLDPNLQAHNFIEEPISSVGSDDLIQMWANVPTNIRCVILFLCHDKQWHSLAPMSGKVFCRCNLRLRQVPDVRFQFSVFLQLSCWCTLFCPFKYCFTVIHQII